MAGSAPKPPRAAGWRRAFRPRGRPGGLLGMMLTIRLPFAPGLILAASLRSTIFVSAPAGGNVCNGDAFRRRV